MALPDPDDEQVSGAAVQAAARLKSVADIAAARLEAVAQAAARQLVEVAAIAAETREVSGELADTVDRLAKRAGKNEQRTSRISRRVAVTLLLLAVDIPVTVAIGLLWNNQADTNRRIQAATDHASAVQTHVVNILCPLYKLFVDSYDPKARAAMTAAGQVHYDTQYAIITRGYRDLNCQAISGAAKTPPIPSPAH